MSSSNSLARFKVLDRILGFDNTPRAQHHDRLHAEERACKPTWEDAPLLISPDFKLTSILTINTVLPRYNQNEIQSAIPAPEVTKICLRLRHLIRECVPCEMDTGRVTSPHSKIITHKVIKAAKEAGSPEHRGCVVYALLVNQHWFKHEAMMELWDADLHNLRATACGVIAKAMQVYRELDTMNLIMLTGW